jgi:DNA-binding transcriptional regulator YiaG
VQTSRFNNLKDVDIVLLTIELNMNADELRLALQEMEVSQAEFARLVDVSPSAISLWLGAERGIPGPTEAYVRLLRPLPSARGRQNYCVFEKGLVR